MISSHLPAVTKTAICVSLTVATCVLWGCAFPPGIYNEAGLRRDQLAFVDTNATLGEVVQIANVYDASGRRVLGTDSWTAQSRWKQLELQPGEYVIVALCLSGLGRAEAYPRLRVSLEAGKRYLLACEIVEGKGVLGNKVPKAAKLVLKDKA